MSTIYLFSVVNISQDEEPADFHSPRPAARSIIRR
jgi:hypothetical protein